MEESLSKSGVKIKSIAIAYDEAVRSLEEDPVKVYRKTGIAKLDSVIGGGVRMNQLVTIGGISGSGKSALANIIETNIAKNYEDIVVLNLSFEMTAKDQILRKFSAMGASTVQSLREKMSSSTGSVDSIPEELNGLKNLNIFYVEESCSVPQILEVIESFKKRCSETNKWLIVFIDHALLVDGKSTEERTNVGDLQKALIKLKKTGKITIFQLMQLNRNIEAAERRTNKNMHYPIRGDLSTADAVYQASDFVWIIHRPELLGIMSYGIHEVECKNKIFIHVIKSREGEQCHLIFDNNLSINKIE